MPLQINNRNGEKVIDCYNSVKKWERWIKDPKIYGITKENEKIIIKFLKDKKKEVSHRRINDLRRELPRITKLLEQHLELRDITKITDEQYSAESGSLTLRNIFTVVESAICFLVF